MPDWKRTWLFYHQLFLNTKPKSSVKLVFENISCSFSPSLIFLTFLTIVRNVRKLTRYFEKTFQEVFSKSVLKLLSSNSDGRQNLMIREFNQKSGFATSARLPTVRTLCEQIRLRSSDSRRSKDSLAKDLSQTPCRNAKFFLFSSSPA